MIPLYQTAIMEHWALVLSLVVLSFVCIVGLFALQRALDKRRSQVAPVKLMTSMLNDAFRHHCRFIARCETSLDALPDEIELRPLALHGLKLRFAAASDSLKADAVGDFFSLFLYYKIKNRYRYFTLRSRLEQVAFTAQGEQSGVLVLHPPMHEGQRRRFLRVSPPEYMCSINQLQYAQRGSNSAASLISLSPECVSLRDISSGGMRLHVHPSFEGYADLTKGDILVVNITFTNRNATACTTMEIAGICLNVMQIKAYAAHPPSKSLCIMFKRLCLAPLPDAKPTWTAIDATTGVQAMHNWIMQVQLHCAALTSTRVK